MKNRIGALDGIKGISALLIACVYHLATVPFPYASGLPLEKVKIFNWIYRFGYIFVEVFLFVSGYTAFYHYTEKIEHGLGIWDFLKRRIQRIFPVMWITLVSAVVGEIIYFSNHEQMFWWGGGNNTILTLFLNVFGLQAIFNVGQSWNYPGWSLSIFFLCWLIYWCIITIAKESRRKKILGCLIMIMVGIIIQISYPNIAIPGFTYSAARGYISFFGGGLFLLINEALSFETKKISVFISITWLVFVGILCKVGISLEPFSTTMALAIIPMVMVVLLNSTIMKKILEFKLFLFLGKISFSLYLCNYSIEIFTAMINEVLDLNINFSGVSFFVGNILIQILISSIVYYFFEVRIMECIKKRDKKCTL